MPQCVHVLHPNDWGVVNGYSAGRIAQCTGATRCRRESSGSASLVWRRESHACKLVMYYREDYTCPPPLLESVIVSLLICQSYMPSISCSPLFSCTRTHKSIHVSGTVCSIDCCRRDLENRLFGRRSHTCCLSHNPCPRARMDGLRPKLPALHMPCSYFKAVLSHYRTKRMLSCYTAKENVWYALYAAWAVLPYLVLSTLLDIVSVEATTSTAMFTIFRRPRHRLTSVLPWAYYLITSRSKPDTTIDRSKTCYLRLKRVKFLLQANSTSSHFRLKHTT